MGDKHRIIRHADHDYLVGAVHTNTIEGFWSLLKRGVVGTFPKVNAKSAAARRGVSIPILQQ
jgi:hypothetical protein